MLIIILMLFMNFYNFILKANLNLRLQIRLQQILPHKQTIYAAKTEKVKIMTTVELYYSDTCQNCHQLRAILMEILPKNMKFKEINISYPEGQRRASELNIMSVPAVAIDGEVMFVGRISREEILKEISSRK